MPIESAVAEFITKGQLSWLRKTVSADRDVVWRVTVLERSIWASVEITLQILSKIKHHLLGSLTLLCLPLILLIVINKLNTFNQETYNGFSLLFCNESNGCNVLKNKECL